MRLSGLRELLSDDEVERLAPTVEVPWILPSLRKEWNRQQATVALWWAENSK
jgi:putative transposase